MKKAMHVDIKHDHGPSLSQIGNAGQFVDLQRWFCDPLSDVTESAQHYWISCDVPGVKMEDVEVKVDKNSVTIDAFRNQVQSKVKKKIRVLERNSGKLVRTYFLPEQIEADSLRAALIDGVLEIRIKKV